MLVKQSGGTATQDQIVEADRLTLPAIQLSGLDPLSSAQLVGKASRQWQLRVSLNLAPASVCRLMPVNVRPALVSWPQMQGAVGCMVPSCLPRISLRGATQPLPGNADTRE